MLLLRSVNNVQVHCDCGARACYNEELSVDFMRSVMAVAQGYREFGVWVCPLCKRQLRVDGKRAKAFLRLWTI